MKFSEDPLAWTAQARLAGVCDEIASGKLNRFKLLGIVTICRWPTDLERQLARELAKRIRANLEP